MKVIHKQLQMVNLHDQYLRLKGEIDAGIQQVLDSCSFINGQAVKDFERNLSQYMGGCHVIPCGSGTDALQIAFMALGLRPGDEVIVPSFTYVASVEAIATQWLKPVFVDVDYSTFNMDTSQIEAAITDRTRAIIPVHLFGQMCEMDKIVPIAAKHKLYIVEDAAQAMGAGFYFMEVGKVMAGTYGTIGCTSFFPSKNLGCYGDGGAIFAHNDQLAEHLRMIANHGQKTKYQHDIIGINSRLDSIQAAVLNAKLPYLDDFNRVRKAAAAYYDDGLYGIPGVVRPEARCPHVYHQYTLKVQRRDELKAFLAERGIPTMVYYPKPIHQQEAYRHLPHGPLPVSEKLSQEVLSLPMHTELTHEEQDVIIQAIREFYGK